MIDYITGYALRCHHDTTSELFNKPCSLLITYWMYKESNNSKKNTKLTIHVQHKCGDFNLMTPLIYACL